jgi:hypothetical protein
MTLSAASSRVKVAIFSAMLLISVNAFGQKQTGPLAQPRNSIGTAPKQGNTSIPVLTEPNPQPVVPNQIQQGELIRDVETHEWRIKELESDVKMMLTDVNFAKGVFWFLGGVIAIIAFVIAKWWKPIVRYFLKDAYVE